MLFSTTLRSVLLKPPHRIVYRLLQGTELKAQVTPRPSRIRGGEVPQAPEVAPSHGGMLSRKRGERVLDPPEKDIYDGVAVPVF